MLTKYCFVLIFTFLLLTTVKSVLNGEFATQSYPWLASLKIGGENLCGGSLIHPQWILTAAHCIQRVKKPKLTEVHLNSTSLYKGFSVSVTKHLPHEKYNYERDMTHYDIGLLKLQEPVPDTAAIPISLPTSGNSNTTYGGVTAMALGWGRTEFVGITSKLRKTYIPIVDNRDCARQLISSHQICANIEKGKGLACHGDSGGPLVIEQNDEQFMQIGVASYGAPIVNGEHCHSYDLYTKITPYLKWIKNTMENN